MKALLIIDMQIGSFKPYSSRHNTTDTIKNINLLSNHFRNNRDKIIFIQHDGTKENCFLPNSVDWELLPELYKSDEDIFINKTANDSFYNTPLEKILLSYGITDLTITGCATDFCIDSTIKSALTKDYKITVVEDRHTTASRLHMDAINLIKHYNWIWKETIPTKYQISIEQTARLISA